MPTVMMLYFSYQKKGQLSQNTLNVQMLQLSINDAHTKKLQFSTNIFKNRVLAASNLFYICTISIKFYAFPCHVLKSSDVYTR